MGNKYVHFLLVSVLLSVTLYDCQDLATGCSSCVGSNLGTRFMCGWCVTSGGSCEVQAECSNPLITIGDNCPVPVITSISPTTGSYMSYNKLVLFPVLIERDYTLITNDC